ncbi:MAG TPA: capsular polysaccharide biosynthesis protein [Ideonella sp.]|uniref:capsular polysaccharide biosynthesis protein n=1 Tax=Ideonella sp. TaxID=1929293 RepID=UPI002BED95BB|nr:capsular polysaccharide biosynthesis protein [Ideonella sp.]HSI50750.1 capsular polysaccharide biosynthesis protein [Ideonella sp.]
MNPPDLLATLRCAVQHGSGVAGVRTLPALLAGVELVSPRRAAAAGAQAVLAWGRKASAERALAWGRAHGLQPLWLEDGFLRSIGLGADEPPLSIVLDDEGIYYDASAPSRLERLIRQPLDELRRSRAMALQAQWQAMRVSKYNQAREALPAGLRLDGGEVLVVDQTAGDASIGFGAASAISFARMLQAALDEHPRARILLKVHPDVVAGRKRGHFGALSPALRSRVTLLGESLHPAALLSQVAAVYVVTSQMGFEALLWGRPVRCFGLPFYAGWGLTGDDQLAPVRRQPAETAALVHAALVDYPRYLDPETGARCEPERLLAWMGLQRAERERFPPRLHAVGFSGWKRPVLRRFLAGSELTFARAGAAVASGEPVVVWGQRELPAPPPGRPAPAVIRVEDGFLRSVGLGADLVRPLSWVLDDLGLYYDSSRPSALERWLNQASFSPALRERAAALRGQLLALGLTKYNLGGGGWVRPAGAAGRQVVLVVGQVESDAAIVHGAPGIRTNMGLLQAVREQRPQAWLVYKPHPDVVAKLRAQGDGEGEARRWCDEILTQAPMDALLRQVDEVQVLTSLAGFEALLREVPVVTWGCPFYAGWGLTEDRLPQPRRERKLSLDELTAAVLILYPRYVSRHSGAFASPESAAQELQDWRDSSAANAGPPSLGRRSLRLALRWLVALRRSGVPLRQRPALPPPETKDS